MGCAAGGVGMDRMSRALGVLRFGPLFSTGRRPLCGNIVVMAKIEPDPAQQAEASRVVATSIWAQGSRRERVGRAALFLLAAAMMGALVCVVAILVASAPVVPAVGFTVLWCGLITTVVGAYAWAPDRTIPPVVLHSIPRTDQLGSQRGWGVPDLFELHETDGQADRRIARRAEDLAVQRKLLERGWNGRSDAQPKERPNRR